MQFNNSGDGKYFQQLLCQKNIRACMMYDVGCVIHFKTVTLDYIDASFPMNLL